MSVAEEAKDERNGRREHGVGFVADLLGCVVKLCQLDEFSAVNLEHACKRGAEEHHIVVLLGARLRFQGVYHGEDVEDLQHLQLL